MNCSVQQESVELCWILDDDNIVLHEPWRQLNFENLFKSLNYGISHVMVSYKDRKSVV